MFGSREDSGNSWETQARQLMALLESDRDGAMSAIDEAAEADKKEIPVDEAFSDDAAAIIAKIFNENRTFLIGRFRTWANDSLKCNVEERDGKTVLTWDDPSLLKGPDEPPRYGDET